MIVTLAQIFRRKWNHDQVSEIQILPNKSKEMQQKRVVRLLAVIVAENKIVLILSFSPNELISHSINKLNKAN